MTVVAPGDRTRLDTGEANRFEVGCSARGVVGVAD